MKRVRNALISKTLSPYPDIEMSAPVYEPFDDTPDVVFAGEFTKVGGKYFFCETTDELISDLKVLVQTNNFQPLFCNDPKLHSFLKNSGIQVVNNPDNFSNVNAAITFCEFLIARTGSIMVSSRTGHGRRINIFPNIHIVVASSKQLVPDLKQAFAAMKEKYPLRLPSMINVVTGPSRTADIEKTLVMGAHGPKELYLFFIDNPS